MSARMLAILATIAATLTGLVVWQSGDDLASAGEVPAADIRVYGGPDGTVRLADDPAVSAGVCRTYGDTDGQPPHGHPSITVCVPLYGPDGTYLTGQVEEDGSARYGTAERPRQWVLDPETSTFQGTS